MAKCIYQFELYKVFSYVVCKNISDSPWLGWPLCNVCVTNDHGYVPLVVNTSRSFPRSWLITGFVTRLTPVELLSLPEHLGTPRLLVETRSLVLCVCFVDRCLSFCTFFSWPLCCLFFFDLQILVIPLVFSNSSNRYTTSRSIFPQLFFPQYFYGMISNTTLLYIQSDKS